MDPRGRPRAEHCTLNVQMESRGRSRAEDRGCGGGGGARRASPGRGDRPRVCRAPWRDLLDQGMSWDPQGQGWEEQGVTATYQSLCKYFHILPTSGTITVCDTKHRPWRAVETTALSGGQTEPRSPGSLRDPFDSLCVEKGPELAEHLLLPFTVHLPAPCAL